MRLLSALLVPVLCMGLLMAGCGEPGLEQRLKAAQKAMEKGDYDAAAIELKAGLQSAPDSGQLRFALGSLLLERGDPAGAVLELRKALDRGHKEDALVARLATSLVADGKYKEVTDAYAEVTLNDAVARTELASAVAAAWLGQRSLNNASRVVEQTLKVAPEYSPALQVRARLLAMDKRFDEALALAVRAAANGPGVGDAHVLRAMLLGAAKKDRQGAIAALEQAAKYPSVAVTARSGLIQLHLGARDLQKAKSELAMLQKSHPKHPNTVYLSAVLAYSDGKLEQVEALTDALLKLAPDSAQVLTLAGAGHLRRGALVAAEAKLGRVVQTAERAPLARKLLADTYLRMGQADKALAALGPMIAEASDADVLATAAQAHLQKGRVAEAESAFNAALKLKPDDINLRTSMVLTELAKGKAESAFDALQQLATQDSGHTADLALITAHLQRREFDRALAAISKLEQKLTKAAMPLHLRGVALMGNGDQPGARRAFEAALAVDPTYFASTALLVSLDVKERDLGAAQRRAEEAIKLAPQNLAARMTLIDVLRVKGSPHEEVLRAIDEALRMHPAEPLPHLAKLAHLGRHRGAKDAAGHAQTALAALPSHPQILDAAGQALAEAGEDQQALSAFNRLTAVLPKSPLPYLRMADVYARRGRHTDTVSMLNRAFDVAPESPDVHQRLIDQALRSKDYGTVMAAARQLQRRSPPSAEGYLLEGAAEVSRKAWPAAIAAYRQALARPDPQGRAVRLYYLTVKASGDPSAAKQFADEWLRKHPRDVSLRAQLGGEAITTGRLSDAERYFREVIEIQPRSWQALNNLAWLMAEQRHPGAVAMAQRALEIAPNAAPVLDTMAKALDASGQTERAVEFQRQALDASGGQPLYRLTLARLLVKAGKKDGAKKELEQLAALGSRFEAQKAVAALQADIQR